MSSPLNQYFSKQNHTAYYHSSQTHHSPQQFWVQLERLLQWCLNYAHYMPDPELGIRWNQELWQSPEPLLCPLHEEAVGYILQSMPLSTLTFTPYSPPGVDRVARLINLVTLSMWETKIESNSLTRAAWALECYTQWYVTSQQKRPPPKLQEHKDVNKM